MYLDAVGNDVDGVESGLEVFGTVVGHLADGDASRVDFKVKMRQRRARFEAFGLQYHFVDRFPRVLDTPKSSRFPFAQEFHSESGRKTDSFLIAFGRHIYWRRSFVDLVRIFRKLEGKTR